MQNTKRLAYVSFHYPPSTTVASLQHKYMVSHLSKLGWKVDVVTIREEDTAREIGPNDPSLVDVLEEINVHRTSYISIRNLAIRLKDRIASIPGRILGFSRRESRQGITGKRLGDSSVSPVSKIKNLVTDEFLSFPDRHSAWIWKGYAAAREVIRNKGSRIIFSSGPPHSTLVIGYLLKKKFGLPLVLEFRDPWVGNPYHGHKSALFLILERRLQKKILQSADHIRASTEHLMRHLLSIEPACMGKISVGGAGFPDFINNRVDTHSSHIDNPYTITHAGTMYAQRNPKNFLRAARRLLAEGVISKGGLQIQFFGGCDLKDSEFISLLGDPILSPVVRMGEVTHAACVEAMLNSDLLLTFQQGTQLQVPAKIYEYLSLGRPMLTIADKGSATWDLIHREGFGICVQDEQEEIFRVLCSEYSARARTGGKRFYQNAAKYSFRVLSDRFNDDLERLLLRK